MNAQILVESSARSQGHPQPKSYSGNLRFVTVEIVAEAQTCKHIDMALPSDRNTSLQTTGKKNLQI